jgi:hypothetical protein
VAIVPDLRAAGGERDGQHHWMVDSQNSNRGEERLSIAEILRLH